VPGTWLAHRLVAAERLGPLGCLQAGDSFDAATLLASILLGAGYNAYVVAGYAPSWVAGRDLSQQPCPLSLEQLPAQAESGIGAVAAAAARAGEAGWVWVRGCTAAGGGRGSLAGATILMQRSAACCAYSRRHRPAGVTAVAAGGMTAGKVKVVGCETKRGGAHLQAC